MPVIMMSQAEGLTAATYNQVLNGLKELLQKAPGLISHTAHETDEGLRIVELWQSKPESDRFFAEHVAPNLPPGIRPKRRTLDLVSFVTPAPAGQ